MVRTVSLLCCVAFLVSSMAFAASIPIGFISWDVGIPASTGTFDITNETGPNSSTFPDPTWPVSTPVNLGSLSLTVDFSDGSMQTFGSSYFTLAPDGLSFDGSTIPIGGANPQPTDATLTGTFSPTTITENDGSVHTIDSSFSATISPSSPPDLSDGDNAIIFATEAGATVPEPAFVSWVLLGTFFVGLVAVRNRQMFGKFRTLLSARRGLNIALFLVAVLTLQSQSWAQVKLNASTSPSNGVAGVTFVNATGSGFPSGTITPANVNVTLALVCGAPPAAITMASTVTHILGSSYRLHFEIPGSLATGTYFVQVSDITPGDANFTSTNCSQVQVTHTSTVLSACVPSSSLGVLAPVTGPANVTAYTPNGAWSESFTGIQVVQIENPSGPLAAPVSVPTTGAINSCAANPATSEAVCVDNGTGVYELMGTTLSATLTSAANAFAGFTGGDCKNCGVAINALTNQALISMGTTAGPGTSGYGVQLLDLNTNTFMAPFGMNHNVSENPLIDPTRALILTPGEDANYTLLQVGPGGALTEFGNAVGFGDFDLDSAGEDCSTGIALATSEFTGDLILADLTQAIFDPVAHTWTAGPGNSALQSQNLPEFAGLAAGTSGISIAQGTSHQGIVAGEFAGNTFGVIQLPSTSGSGTPSVTDYAYATMPTLPSGASFENGLDPHTTTAYTSPNDGKAYGLMASGYFTKPTFLGKVDLACVLAQPRNPGTHTVAGSVSSCVVYIPTGN